MYKIISSAELKGRVIKLLTKSGKYIVTDNKDNSLDNIVFVNEMDALDIYKSKVFTLTEKEIKV